MKPLMICMAIVCSITVGCAQISNQEAYEIALNAIKSNSFVLMANIVNKPDVVEREWMTHNSGGRSIKVNSMITNPDPLEAFVMLKDNDRGHVQIDPTDE